MDAAPSDDCCQRGPWTSILELSQLQFTFFVLLPGKWWFPIWSSENWVSGGLIGQNSGEATLEPRFAWHKLWLLNIGPFGKYLPRRYWTLQQFKEKTWELSYLRCHLCSSQIWRSRIPPLKKQTNNWTPIPYYKYSILWIILSDLCFVSKFFFPIDV